jgi:hypothetical protein
MEDLLFWTFVVKRGFCFLDEWLFYYFLMYCMKHRRWRELTVGGLIGIFLIITAYKNLSLIENCIELKTLGRGGCNWEQWMIYPFWR